MGRHSSAALLILGLLAAPVRAEDPPRPSAEAGATKSEPKRFRLSGEIKANLRHSTPEEFKLSFPFPPSFLPPGENSVSDRTVAPGTSAEISDAALIGEADLTPDISARLRIDILDLYNRNPTSSEDRVFVREAWIRFGRSFGPLEAIPGTTLYALVGKAPRFSKQKTRRLESYGLWGTTVARFEEVQLQLGGTFGTHVYWRAHAANPNPLFIRDPNALAGDNGTPERVPGNVHPIYQSGFPILYDAKSTDVSFNGKFEIGGGVGYRLLSADEESGVDVLAWYVRRDLLDSIPIRGSFYSGDIKLFQAFAGFGIAFNLDGREKVEYGANLEARLGDLHVFAQVIHQDIAGLKRSGFELEAGWFVSLHGGLFLSGETPVLTFVEPAVRVSLINNDFFTPRLYPGVSIGWDWRKYDFGFRVGILRGVDLTVEYTRNDVILFDGGGRIHPDETLVTLRAGF